MNKHRNVGVFEDQNVRTYFDPLHGVVNFCTDGVRGITGILGVLGDEAAHLSLSGLERGGDALPGDSGDTQSTKAALAP